MVVLSKSLFRQKLRALSQRHGTQPRRWVFVPYDQLNDQFGPLARAAPGEVGVVLVENPWKAARRPYHRQKLALVLANLRHFALEQAARGVAVKHIVADGPYATALMPVARELGPLDVMEPAERELRVDLQPLVAAGLLNVLPHEGWLTTPNDFQASQPKGPPYRMDAFYRYVRRKTGLLMQGGKPLGGKFSHDSANRRPWPGEPAAPLPPTFPTDPIKREVAEVVTQRFRHHPGQVDLEHLPATHTDAQLLWRWAREHCLPRFGPFEDAMSSRSRGLFHTRISALLNLHRLLPSDVVRDVCQLPLPVASQEGFLRQVLGWREFVRHLHRVTDGFRDLPSQAVPIAESPGDGGYARWAGRPWPTGTHDGAPDGGACPNHLGAHSPLPEAYWGKTSGLNCLDRVVADVWHEGYSHHITRLMVLANIATLLDVEPRQLADWFWLAYVDAFDWVVEPNVLGMGTYAAGDFMTTKPYISGAAYLDKMSDYCGDCRFDPKHDCPLTRLYWAFLNRHQAHLAGNQRMSLAASMARRREGDQQARDAEVFALVRDKLAAGQSLAPADFADARRSQSAAQRGTLQAKVSNRRQPPAKNKK